MFFVGERTNSDPTQPAVRPYHYVPDYTLVNGRVEPDGYSRPSS